MSEDSNKGFVIKDKRRFEADGEARTAEAKAEGEQEKNEQAKPSFILKEESEGKPRSAETATIDFGSFIMSLATQTLIQLGEVKPPNGVNIPIDVESARQTIEVITMLEEKTRGNLEPQEAQMIGEILHSLRLSFLKHAQK